jgi:hypothetical protein
MVRTRYQPARTSSKRVTFAVHPTVHLLIEDEDYRIAHRGTWILQRRIFEQRIRHLESLLRPIFNRYVYRLSNKYE